MLAGAGAGAALCENVAGRNPGNITLWLVPGARHTAAYDAAPLEFRVRVLGWFADHTAGWQAKAPGVKSFLSPQTF